MLQCLCDVLQIYNGFPGQTLETALLPLTLGGLGVGGSARVRDAAFWGSWADCLEMVKARHPQVAQDMITGFRSQRSPCLSSVTGAIACSRGVGQKGVRCGKCGSLNYAGKAARECPQTSCCGTCTYPRHTALSDDVWKWWSKGCVCSAGASFLWMPRLHAPRRWNTHRMKTDAEDGVALKEARRSKEATYPELFRGDGRARLVVIAGEAGGRKKTKDFLWCSACEKSQVFSEGSVRAGWFRRWCCLLACSTAKGSGLFFGWAPRVTGVR